MVCQTSVAEGDSVEYGYHYGRLLWSRHSRSPWNDAHYLYGAPTQQDFSAGRVVMKRDASGVTRYGYDDLGNVTLERHTCVVPGERDPVTLTTGWDYDSRGRVMRVLYPDSEYVDYYYDKGGALQSVTGHKPGQPRADYVQNIGYDLHGHRVYEYDGDGVETLYEYDSLSLRLQRMKVRQPSVLLADLHYGYDLQGNIVSVTDSGVNPRQQTFVYDNLHRLVESLGAGTWDNVPLTYSGGYTYSPAGRLLEKEQHGLCLNNMYGIYPVDYDYQYSYLAGPGINPYAADQAYEALQGDKVYFKWTESGAMKQADAHEMMRRQCWDEEVRMQSSFYEDEHGARVAWYGYDDGGERAVKLSGECVALTQNGHTTTMASLTNPVVYASPLVTLTKRGYTKHYFEGERRICSAIGGGFTHVEWDSIDASQDKAVKEICDGLFPLLDDGVEEAMHCVELNDIHLSGRLIYRMLWLEATKPHDDPEPVYYYHNDHLGGTAYLTDQTGQVAQTLAYLPYGEDWVDVTTFMYDTSQIGFYQFNGKEKDPETDYLYYGARYYWPDAWNGWLSPDPLMDEYPNISPYAYCNWNPVNLIDPNGMIFDSASMVHVNKLLSDIDRYIKIDSKNKELYEQARTELSELISSNQIYKIEQVDNEINIDSYEADGYTWYDINTNVVSIQYTKKGGIGSLAHELKHAYQFETGELSFDNSGKYYGLLGDIFDEKHAYNRGSLFGGKNLGYLDIQIKYGFKDLDNRKFSSIYTYFDDIRYATYGEYLSSKRAPINIYRLNGSTYIGSNKKN